MKLIWHYDFHGVLPESDVWRCYSQLLCNTSGNHSCTNDTASAEVSNILMQGNPY